MHDLLTQFSKGTLPTSVSSEAEAPRFSAPKATQSPVAQPFDTPSLQYMAPDSALRESLSVLRISPALISTSDLVTFGARNRSRWALDALAERLTAGLLDWAGLRAELVHSVETRRDYEPLLERITPTNLWRLRQVLESHHLDEEAERALLIIVAERVLAGESFDRSLLVTLGVNLVGAGLIDHLRRLLRIYTNDNYVRHALTVELEHPRFGGSHDLLLARFNQMYRRFGLEAVTLGGPGSSPFTRLRALATEKISDGPLVTIIMSCWSPGEELLLAVRSIVDQSYQNWELIVTDDSSPARYYETLDSVAEMDPRVRVVRNENNAGTYVRRNEALALARGEFVTMQDSDDWSHPRRLEIQVRDLEAHPERFANIVRNVRLTEDLSLYSERGMQLGPCEPAILFRREAVLNKIGFFDSIRKAADREFRQRLEAATGVPVAMIGPEVPMVLMLADVSSLSGSDFRGKWVHPARIAYRSSMMRVHDLIADGEHTAVFPAFQQVRTLDAPATLLGHNPAPDRVDVLVILDGRSSKDRAHFLAEVSQELRDALESGLAVGVMHSDSLRGGRKHGYFPPSMQYLVDDGGLHRVIEDQRIEAGVVVVRHAVALQGHGADTTSILADRVVVIEDRNGGDERGVTFAKLDVLATARGWFGVTPEWVVAAARPVPPSIESVSLKDGDVRVVLTHPLSDAAVEIEARPRHAPPIPMRLHKHKKAAHDSTVSPMIARVAAADLADEAFQLIARIDAHTYEIGVDIKRVLTNTSEPFLLRRPHDRLLISSRRSSSSGAGGVRLDPDRLVASVTAARIRDQRLILEVVSGDEAKLTSIAAVREAHGFLRRRQFHIDNRSSGTFSASRPIEDIAGMRWRVYGVFQTPEGRVQIPLALRSDMELERDEEWNVDTTREQIMVMPTSTAVAGSNSRRWLARLKRRPA